MTLAVVPTPGQAPLVDPAPRRRIMLFLHSFEPGGVERVALRLAGAWAASGCEVIVAMGRHGGPLAAEAPTGVEFVFAPPFALAAHCESLWLVPHLTGLVRRRRPDVLFCAGNTYAVVAVLARALLGRACPPILGKVSNCLVRPDFPPPIRWLYRRWLRLQTRAIDRFVGLTEAMRPELAAGLGVGADRIEIIPDPAIELGDLAGGGGRRGGAGGDGRLFVAVGRLAPQKDFALLLRAFAIDRHPGDRLLILGEGRERSRLEALARRLGIWRQVAMPGHVADVAVWLERADVFVLSSRYEGAPAVVIEALARGTPVVATDCCASMRDLLAGGALGELAPSGDAQALSAAMRRIDHRAGNVVAMRAHAAAFTVERAAPRYLSLIEDLLAAYRTRPKL